MLRNCQLPNTHCSGIIYGMFRRKVCFEVFSSNNSILRLEDLKTAKSDPTSALRVLEVVGRMLLPAPGYQKFFL